MAKATIVVLAASLLLTLSAQAAKPAPRAIARDLQAHHGTEFRSLIEKWQDAYGEAAVPDLLTLARDAKLADSTRYIALLAATKLGGAGTAPHLYGMLEDRSWMIRSAALRSLMLLHPEERTPIQDHALLSALRDRALVVRREAVDAVAALRPRGSVEALLKAASAPENYVQGKAQSIPQSALAALAKFDSPADRAAILPALAPLSQKARDPRVRLAAAQLRKQLGN